MTDGRLGGRAALRKARSRIARALGHSVARHPALEAPFVAVGRAAARGSRALGSLYFEAHGELLRHLTDDTRYRTLIVGGTPMKVDITDHTGRLHFFHREPYEPEVANAIANALAPGNVFIDVGANAGLFSVLGALRVGSAGRVASFEPHPAARNAMTTLATRNGVFDRIEISTAAVGNHVEDKVPLYLSSDSVLSTLAPSAAPLGSDYAFDRWIDVPLTTLDEWARINPALAGRLTAVKIDVEGAEDAVVAGMVEIFQIVRQLTVICETRLGSTADRHLRACGFVARVLNAREDGFGNYLYQRFV